MKKFLVMIAVGLVMSTAAFSEGLFLKLSGGVNSLTGGDYNTIIQGRNDLYKNFPGLTVSSQLEKLTLGVNLGGEFIFCPSDYFGIGLGFDYIQASNDSTLNAAGTGGLTLSNEFTPLFRSVGLGLSLHGFLPLSETIVIHASAGPCLCFGTLKLDETTTYSTIGLNETLYFDSKSTTALGLQGMVGLEIALSDVVFLGIEAKGRLLQFNEIKGDWTLLGSTSTGIVSDAGSGTAWYEELQSGANYYPTLVYKGLEPGGLDVRNVREFVVSLSGLGIQVSLRFGL